MYLWFTIHEILKHFILIIVLCTGFTFISWAQCPEITKTTINPSCTPSCTMCEGETFTVTLMGGDLPNNGKIEYYYSDNAGFNPYNVSFANAEKWQRNATGIQVYGSGSYNNIIIHNITYANEDSGLQFYNMTHNNFVIGNLTYGNGDHGIDFVNSPNNIAVSNTVQGNHTAGINLEGSATPGSSGAKVFNNISVDNGIAPITGQKSNIRVDASSVSGTTMDLCQLLSTHLMDPSLLVGANGQIGMVVGVVRAD